MLDAFPESLADFDKCFNDGVKRRRNAFKQWRVGSIPKRTSSKNPRTRALAAKQRAESHAPSVAVSARPSAVPVSNKSVIHAPNSMSFELTQHNSGTRAASELSDLSALRASPSAASGILELRPFPFVTAMSTPRTSKKPQNKRKHVISEDEDEDVEPPSPKALKMNRTNSSTTNVKQTIRGKHGC
ncbi:hypothetical protein K439DRAFT_1660572 [Ramaria rubella]|nr:hypothetical protein K439DRAFT_1660572 [Ramaria rubella]